MLPSGYFVSTGSCFQRFSTGFSVFAGAFRMYFVLALCTTVSLKTLLQRCYRLVISSLLDLVSRVVPTGYFVSAGGFRMYFVLALCTPVFLKTLLQKCHRLVISSLLDLVSRDVPT